jgi:uncharacterized protein YjiS (DUF1127 family)
MKNWIDTIGASASIGRSVSLTSPGTGILASLGKVAVRAVDTLLQWQQRSMERHHLSALNDHLLKDVGLSRADVAQESGKPFWRD